MDMKVKDLIDLLGDFDAEAEVAFAYNYGDYWRTQVAQPVTEVGDAQVIHSAYHNMDKVLWRDGDEDEDDSPADARNIVLLG
jgi:hypothetical protein